MPSKTKQLIDNLDDFGNNIQKNYQLLDSLIETSEGAHECLNIVEVLKNGLHKVENSLPDVIEKMHMLKSQEFDFPNSDIQKIIIKKLREALNPVVSKVTKVAKRIQELQKNNLLTIEKEKEISEQAKLMHEFVINDRRIAIETHDEIQRAPAGRYKRITWQNLEDFSKDFSSDIKKVNKTLLKELDRFELILEEIKAVITICEKLNEAWNQVQSVKLEVNSFLSFAQKKLNGNDASAEPSRFLSVDIGFLTRLPTLDVLENSYSEIKSHLERADSIGSRAIPSLMEQVKNGKNPELFLEHNGDV